MSTSLQLLPPPQGWELSDTMRVQNHQQSDACNVAGSRVNLVSVTADVTVIHFPGKKGKNSHAFEFEHFPDRITRG
uniref:Uncharacterized protein n=1 Tax=Aegilops tauschii TaxID=37682 RepID=M8BJS1_AEGTA